MSDKVYNVKEKRVRMLLIEKGMSQTLVAKQMGITTQALHQRLKRGNTDEILKTIHKISSHTAIAS